MVKIFFCKVSDPQIFVREEREGNSKGEKEQREERGMFKAVIHDMS